MKILITGGAGFIGSHLADEPAMRTRLAASAREFVTEHYNRDHLAETFLATLESVAAGGRGTEIVAPNDREAVTTPEMTSSGLMP